MRIVDGIPHGRLVSHDGGETLGPRTDSAHLHRIQREEQSGKQNQQQAHNRIHCTGLPVRASEQLAVARVTMIQEDEQRYESHKGHDRDQNGPLRASRHEAHQIARVGFQKVQIARQNRLISYRNLEMLNHRNNECHRQKNRCSHPESVGKHEQNHVQHAPQEQIQHRYEIGAGEHLSDESPACEPHII